MKTQKLIIGTLVAGVAMFFLGYLVYGMMLMNFMSENITDPAGRPMEEFVWWAMISSNLVWGLLLTLILNWSGAKTMGDGIKTGAILGLLAGFGTDLLYHGMSTKYNNLTVIIVDALALGVMYAIAGGLTAWVLSKSKTEA